MLESELADTVIAPPGCLLVEREDLQKTYSGILLLSNSYKTYTLGASATVLSVGVGVRGFQKGEKILLAASAGKPIEFGWKPDRTLWRIYPGQVMMKLQPETEAKDLGYSPTRGMKDSDLSLDVRVGHDEGDPQGLR